MLTCIALIFWQWNVCYTPEILLLWIQEDWDLNQMTVYLNKKSLKDGSRRMELKLQHAHEPSMQSKERGYHSCAIALGMLPIFTALHPTM